MAKTLDERIAALPHLSPLVPVLKLARDAQAIEAGDHDPRSLEEIVARAKFDAAMPGIIILLIDRLVAAHTLLDALGE